MSRHQSHSSRNERSHPHSHSRRDTRRDARHETRHEKKKVTTKNLAATLGMMGLAIGATLLTEGGPWKSRMAAAATVVGMEHMLESGGFFDGKGEVAKEEDEGRRERAGRGERVERRRRGVEEDRRRRDVEDDDGDDDDERAYRHRRERAREEEDRRETRGMRYAHDSHERTRRETHDEDDQRRRERRARRDANRRFDEQYEIEEVPV